MARKFSVVDNSGLLDDSGELSGILSDTSTESLLRAPRKPTLAEALDPESIKFRAPGRPEARSFTPSLRDREIAAISEATGDTKESFREARTGVEIAEVLFPPLGMANLLHDAGKIRAEGLLQDSTVGKGLGAGLLAMAIVPGMGTAKKTVAKVGPTILAATKKVITQTFKDASITETSPGQIDSAVNAVGETIQVLIQKHESPSGALSFAKNLSKTNIAILQELSSTVKTGKELIEATAKIFPEVGSGEFNVAFTSVLKAKNIKPSAVTEDMIQELNNTALKAIEKVNNTGGDIIGAGMAEKSGSEMQAILANMKTITDDIGSINVLKVDKQIISEKIEEAITSVLEPPGSPGDVAFMTAVKSNVSDIIKNHGGVHAAAKAQKSLAPGSVEHQILKEMTVGELPETSFKSPSAALAKEIDDLITKHGSVEEAIDNIDASTSDAVENALIDIFNANAPGAQKSAKLADAAKVEAFKQKLPSEQFSDVFDATITATGGSSEGELGSKFATSDINEIAQKAIDLLAESDFNIDAAIIVAQGLKGQSSPIILTTLKELAIKIGLSSTATKPLVKTLINKTSTVNANTLVREIQTGIQSINIADAVKVDKFLERRGWSEDILKRRSKLVLDQDMKDLFEIKEAVLVGNVNETMSKIAQRDVHRVLRRMPKESVERKEFIDTLKRKKEAGFDLSAWHATTKELAKDLLKSGEFKLEMVGSNFGSKREQAIFLSPSPESAKSFGEVLLPLTIRSKDPMIVDMKRLRGETTDFSVELIEEIIQAAKIAKKDVVIIQNINDSGGLQDQILVLDPKLIRSIFAKFKNLDSANLSAGVAGASALPFAIKANNKTSEPES